MQLFKSYSDQKIIQAIRTGGIDEDRVVAFLMKKNENSIYSYVLKNSGNRDAASMILVEGVTELVLNIRMDKFKGNSTISTYLFSICKSLWLQKLKKDKKLTTLTNENLNTLSDEPSNNFDPDKLREELDGLLEKIGESCKKVLDMWSVHYSMAEIANSLGFKNAFVAANKKRDCLTKLKSKVSRDPELRERLKNYLS